MRVKFISTFFHSKVLATSLPVQPYRQTHGGVYLMMEQKMFFLSLSEQWLRGQLSICHHVLFNSRLEHGHFYILSKDAPRQGWDGEEKKINFHRSSKTDDSIEEGELIIIDDLQPEDLDFY